MYKTVSIQPDTYQQLHAVSVSLDKPKAQVIKELLQDFIRNSKDREQKQLAAFNTKMRSRIKKLRLPKGIQVNTTSIDRTFASWRGRTI